MARKKTQRKTRAEAASRLSPAPAGPPSPSGWIISPWTDSILFIGAPLVVMSAFLPLRGYLSSEQIAIFLLAFFTFGHHLPGFFRAYGDKELFARFRWRFLLAPPVFLALALWFDAKSLHGLLLFVAAWDIWHVLMQHYGFMRIYDAKRGSVTPVTSWLDWAFALSWYVTLIANSPHYRHNMLSRAYQSGLPLLSPTVVETVVTALNALVAVLTVMYVGYHLHRWLSGRPVSLKKLAMMGIFLGATYYLYVYIDDFLVGFTVWSAFHCIQYYGIVWAFNSNRVARRGPVTAFVQFLFRPRMGLIALYGVLILAYGSINLLPGYIGDELLRRLLMAFVFTSNALHYYYDGFIWKVREPQTREYLDIASVGPAGRRGLASASASVKRAVKSLRPAGSGLTQAAYLAVIVLVLAYLEIKWPKPQVEVTGALAAAAPEVGEAQYNLGNALWREGRLDEAIATYRRAAELMPGASKVHNNLGGVLFDQGKIDEAIASYRRALGLRQGGTGGAARPPESTSNSPLLPGSAHSAEASLFVIHANLADALARKGESEEALRHYRLALTLAPPADPRRAKFHAGYGATLADLGRYEEGRKELEQALRLDPEYVSAHINLGSLLAYLGENDQAILHYQAALRSEDERARQAAQAAIAQLRSPR